MEMSNFNFLISMLATQVAMSLGVMAPPGEEEAPVDREQAKQFIDLLGMLENKTQGNLEPDESKFLGDTLHQLRMLYMQGGSEQESPAGD